MRHNLDFFRAKKIQKLQMEESKAQALHDALSKLAPRGKGGGLGLGTGAYSWSKQGNEETSDNGLPRNPLYANFVPAGIYDPNNKNKHNHGDGRTIKRKFDDCEDNQNFECEAISKKKIKFTYDKSKLKGLTGDAKKARKKELKKQAKLEAKRLLKLEEKKASKRAAKQASNPQQTDQTTAKACINAIKVKIKRNKNKDLVRKEKKEIANLFSSTVEKIPEIDKNKSKGDKKRKSTGNVEPSQLQQLTKNQGYTRDVNDKMNRKLDEKNKKKKVKKKSDR